MKFLITLRSFPLVLCLTLIFTSATLSQNFEYALSQQEFRDGKITQIELIEDRILFGGSVGQCEYPAVWLFDTIGNLLAHQILDIGIYEIGSIKSMKFNPGKGVIQLMAFVQLGSDYGGQSTYAWILDRDLNILTSSDLFGAPMAAGDSPEISGSFFTVIEGKDFVLFDNNLQLIKRQWFDFLGEGAEKAILVDSTFIFHKHEYTTNRDFIHILDWNGEMIAQESYVNTHLLFEASDHIFTIDKDNLVRKHYTKTLAIIDSIQIPWTEHSEIRKISEEFFSLTLVQDYKVTTNIYNINLDLVFEIQSGLNYETELVTKIQNNTIFQAGKYFGYRPQDFGAYTYFRSIVPFIRKMSLNNAEFSRQNIELVGVSLKNAVNPIRTETNPFGKEFKDFYFMGPGQMLDYELTIRNNSDTILTNFAYFTDEGFGGFCFISNNYRYIDGIHLSQGEEITIRDTMFPYVIYSNRGLLFYAAATNHQLSDSAFTTMAVHDLTTSIWEDNLIPEVSIYPNPAQEKIYFDHPGKNFELNYQIFNMQGQIIVSASLRDTQIDITRFLPGQYWIRFYNSSGITTKKFTKI